MSIDLVTFIASIASALGIVLGFGQWLLSYRLEKYKAEFEATRQSEIQKEVALYLGEKAAEREYLLEARKRLYRAIGPLKFQLLLACRDAASRIKNYVESPYPMDTKSYYGKTTLYRLLKPITLAELIEDQMAFADFAVDPTAITLLSFKKAVYTAFSDGSILDDYPNPNWRKQEEHLFSNSLAAAARSLIIQDDANGTRCMHFHANRAAIEFLVSSLVRAVRILAVGLVCVRVGAGYRLLVVVALRRGRDLVRVGAEAPAATRRPTQQFGRP